MRWFDRLAVAESLFDTVLVYNNKDKPMLRYKFGSVYFFSTLSVNMNIL